MLEPESTPNGGYNQEYRQDPATSGGYIYSNSGSDVDAFKTEILPYLPDTVSFATDATPSDFNRGSLGVNAIPCSATIYPYGGDAPASLPRRFTLVAGEQTVDFLLIARMLSMVPLTDTSDTATSSWMQGEIERKTTQTFFADNVIQELVGEDGSRYVLAAAFGDSTEQYNVNEIGGLADLPLPPGYTYESRVLTEDFEITAEDVAHILVCSVFNFQRYASPAT
jgi:hypothetical protein